MMHKKIAFSLIAIMIGIFIQGCATIAKKQTGKITSDPPGARVYFYEPTTDKTKDIGVTPADAWVQQGLWDIYIVAEKPGFEKEQIKIPKSGTISYHFALERSFALQIADEADSFSADFKKRIAKILGTFDKALSSPRMLSSSVVSDAKTQIQELILDYPTQKESVTVHALLKLLKEATFLTSLSSSYYDSSIERESMRIVLEWITKMKSGLGLIL